MICTSKRYYETLYFRPEIKGGLVRNHLISLLVRLIISLVGPFNSAAHILGTGLEKLQ